MPFRTNSSILYHIILIIRMISYMPYSRLNFYLLSQPENIQLEQFRSIWQRVISIIQYFNLVNGIKFNHFVGFVLIKIKKIPIRTFYIYCDGVLLRWSQSTSILMPNAHKMQFTSNQLANSALKYHTDKHTLVSVFDFSQSFFWMQLKMES